MSTTDAMTAAQREDRVLERIDKFRQRRPRLLDDVVTLAHGAGGKSSAALVDAVFLEAFRNDELEQLGDAAALRTPSGDRLAFSTDSFVVSPRRFPGGSIGHVAVHGTINDLAVSGARPQWLSAAFVIEEGFPIAELREIVADMSEAAAKAGVQIVTGDTKVVGKGAADGALHLDGRRRRDSRGQAAVARPRATRRQGVAVGHHRRARDGGHARPRRPRDRCRHRVRHRARPRTRRAAPRGCAVDAVDARRDPRRRRDGVQRTRQGLPVRARPRRAAACPCSRRCSAPATCSASIRCTSPTRASSSRSLRPRRPMRPSPRCRRTRKAPARRWWARSCPSRTALLR